ncbi:MAG: S8 family serine peptidase [Gammaproteobacteria bacterium]
MKQSTLSHYYLAALIFTSSCYLTTTSADTVVGEDGQAYYVQDTKPKEGLEKIAPSLRLASSDKEIDVIIYLARPTQQAGKSSPIAQVKADHLAILERLDEEIRSIKRDDRPTRSLTEAEEQEYVRSIAGTPMSAAKQSRLDSLKREIDEARTAMHKAVSAAIDAAGRNERAAMRSDIQSAGGQITSEISLVNALGATIRADMLQSLAFDNRVVEVLPNLPADYELEVSRQAVGFPTYHNNGFDGSGIFDIGIIDSGVQENHPNLSPAEGFFTNSSSPTDPDMEVGHGTHVTGIVASNHGSVRGGVPNVGAIIWERSGSQGTTMSRMHNLASDFTQSPEAVNHSLGYGTANDVDYNANDSFYDAYVENFGIMVTKSTGNGGWTTSDPGDPSITITHPASAYNLLAVANMNDRNTVTRDDDIRSSGSSVGPTVGGRRKPDIAAPGTGINSTNFFWPGAGSLPYNACNGPARFGADNIDDFCILSGTSMAAPHVAAGILLMEDAGNTIPRSQKAVMLNTADAWDSNETSTSSDDGEQQAPTCSASDCDTLWDKAYGWGYMDMTEAHFNNNDYFNDSVVGRNDDAIENDYKLYKGFMFANEKATLTWQKRADNYIDGGPATGQRAIGDLNIRLYSNSNGDLMDLDLTATDNVQQVVAPTGATAVVKVYAWSSAFDGITAMPYSLATEENFQRVDPPSFAATPLIPVVGPFQTFTAATLIANNGTTGAHSTNVAIGNVGGVIGDGTSQNVGTILDGDSEQVSFTLTTSGLSAGTQFIPVTVTSNSYNETYTGNFPNGIRFTVETTAPTSDCTTSGTYTNDDEIAVDWTGSDGFGTGVDFARLYVRAPGSAVYQNTGLQQNGTSGTFNFPAASGDGTYFFAIRARDNGGNWESIPTSNECFVVRDSVDPVSTLSAPNFVPAGAIPLTFSVSDASPSSGLEFVDFWYYEAPNGPWTYTGQFSTNANGLINWVPPGPGVYYFSSRAKDNAQNVESDVFAPPPVETVTNYGGIDSDGDGVLDLADNCTLLSNPGQRDTNGDGYGNMCDPDLNNDGVVNFVDIQAWTSFFNVACGNVDEDINGDGLCNFIDYQAFGNFFLQPPGPSGVAP